MSVLRLLVTTIVCLGLALFLGRVVIVGLISGQVAHTNSSAVCSRRRNPVGYWALIALFSVIVVASVIALCRVAYEVIFVSS